MGEGENAGYQHFLPLPQCFQKTFFLKGDIRRHYVANSKGVWINEVKVSHQSLPVLYFYQKDN